MAAPVRRKRIIDVEEEEDSDAGEAAKRQDPDPPFLRSRKVPRRGPGDRCGNQVSPRSSPENDGQIEQHHVPMSQELLEKEKLLKRTIERDKVKREKRRKSSGPEDPAEAGIIESITLVDFMCHRKMEFDFGPQINFIIGHNGSGKSAILTALTLCFGGKASATQRGSKVADFVRDGATRSEITVRIKNQGSEAFLPEKYGTTIVVTRRFSKEGGAQWIVRSADGSYVAAKPREELAYICDAFGIQVDNPLIILSQDTSREFLKSTSPDDKYSLFYRATQLAKLEGDYRAVEENIALTKRIVERRKEVLPSLKKKFIDLFRKVKTLEEVRKFGEDIENHKKQLAWARIEQSERDIAHKEKGIEKQEQKVARMTEEIDEIDVRLNNIEQEIQNVDGKAAAIAEKIRPSEQRRKELVQLVNEGKEKLQDCMSNKNQINERFTRLQRQRNSVQQRIEAEATRLAEENRARREQQLQTIEQLEGEKETLTLEINRCRVEGEQLDTRLRATSDRRTDLAGQRSALQREIRQLESNLRDLEAQRQSRVRAFGNNMPDVLRRIDQQSWTSKPVGPLGMYVSLRSEHSKYSDALESTIGRSLGDFLVQEHSDQQKLQKILSEMNVKCSILISKRDDFDYSQGEPDQRFLTILRALEFNDDTVKRQFIINYSIEKTILVEKRREGDEIMATKPFNVIKCFSSDGYDVGSRTGDQSIVLTRYKGPPRLHADVEEQIRLYQVDRDSKNAQFVTVGEDIRALDRELLQLKLQLDNLKSDVIRRQGELRTISGRVRAIRDEIQQDDPANMVALEEEKTELTQQMELVGNQLVPVLDAENEAQKVLADLKAEYEELEAQQQSYREEMNAVKNIQESLSRKLTNERHNKSHYLAKTDKERADIERAKTQVDGLKAELEQNIEATRSVCPVRMEVTESPRELIKAIEVLQARLRTQEKDQGVSLEELMIAAQRAKDAYQGSKKEIQSLQSYAKVMRKTMDDRWAGLALLRDYIAIRASANFLMKLSNRGFLGELDFDHNEKKLHVRVQPEEQAEGYKDSRGLSGGEKSFSTSCLLLALWDSMGCPLRCLDEFDVFMDAVNRKITMNMMIESARESPKTQYILITPQDQAQIARGPDIKINRMLDPERSSTQAGS